MCLPSSHETHIELAIDVFKARSKALVLSLKDFLTVLPTPKCVEDVLTAAIYLLAERDPDACRWLLRHAYCLEPEIDLVELATKLASTKLQEQGFLLGQDFKFEPKSQLHVTKEAKSRLMIDNSTGDRLLLEEILRVCD